jgi:sulfur carrier protein
MNTIKISVNGNDVEIHADSTVQDFIKERKVTGTMFVVEKNKQIVQKQDYETEKLAQGDKIELVGFFGGG